MEELEALEEKMEEELLAYVPQITSPDPFERKLARKIRIEKRAEQIKRQAAVEEGEEIEEPPAKQTLLQQQLDKSNEVIKNLILDGDEIITNVRVSNDAREVDRRELEGLNREKIIKELEDEANLATEMFDLIAGKWQAVMKYNDPLNIHDAIQTQKEKCDELIRQKDGVISMLRTQIRNEEIKFARDQRLQNEDICTLTKRIEKQMILMRSSYRQELQLIENSMMLERKIVATTNDKRWEELYKKRNEEEIAISDHKFKQLDDFQEEVARLRYKHYEEIRNTKIMLERDFEKLQQERELIKYIAVLNSEKRDYNYQILKKRGEDENIIIKSNQKRMLNKMQDIINSLRITIKKYKDDKEEEARKMVIDIAKLQKYICEIESKSDSMSKINDIKYRQVWDLNTEHAVGKLNKILSIDRLLHEQQMGLNWKKPDLSLLQREDLPSYLNALEVIESAKACLDNSSILSDSEDHGSEDKSYRKLLMHVLTRISAKSGFLIEGRLQPILRPRSEDDKILVKIDNVFSALGIKNRKEVDKLFQYFLPYIECAICSRRKQSDAEISVTTDGTSMISTQPVVAVPYAPSYQSDSDDMVQPLESLMYAVRESDMDITGILHKMVDIERMMDRPAQIEPEGECKGPIQEVEDNKSFSGQLSMSIKNALPSNRCSINHPLAIHQAHILRALRDYVNSAFCSVANKKRPIADTSKEAVVTISRLMEDMDVAMYWDRFKHILSTRRQTLWEGLNFGLQKYQKILIVRDKLNREVLCVRKQNLELRHLLSSYKKEPDKKPPCAIQRQIPICSVPNVQGCKSDK